MRHRMMRDINLTTLPRAGTVNAEIVVARIA